jgi:pimeloyl-ACP methyl ester carboxylesterase
MKTLLFLPGFYDTLKSHDYPAVLKAFESKGYKTEFVPINWRRTTLTHWLKEFNKTYVKYDPSQTVLAGFSFGAVTAFAAAAECNPAELWLCSLSPYFEQDNPKKSDLKFIGKRRAEVFDNIDFPRLAGQIKCRTNILCGQLETDGLKYRARRTHKLIKNSRLIKVPGTKHDITAKAYIESIAQA